MSDQKKEIISADEEIRKLVIARLKLMSPDTLKSIGSMGTFRRDELIKRVEKGDEVGEVVKNIEMEWLRALKSGIVEKLYE